MLQGERSQAQSLELLISAVLHTFLLEGGWADGRSELLFCVKADFNAARFCTKLNIRDHGESSHEIEEMSWILNSEFKLGS